ncbi:MAG TPA: nucleoside triphosphate pyrophosphohydrolase [Vicinamibacterales bacterium]|nr:nucleoside triphosphate pyrophosphohydrolase [Vicinamibacterales bacterium]HPW21112.1 nucleoside triphosphate pyrophosphohydrolase [Vicinamibacterales bacterium]
MPATTAAGAFARLVDTVRILREPGGCPWDREQTLQTLRPFVLEETYEVLDALDRDDRRALREELGDFIFEGVLLAQVCAEAGDFTVADSLEAITEKLIRRHPHVFPPAADASGAAAQLAPATPDEVVERWESIKARESSASGVARTALGGVPAALPALLRAHEIGVRAAAAGFDWERAADVVGKIEEETAELRALVEAGGSADRSRAEEEMGDLLFAIANLSRKLGIEPESALRVANEKFTRRFSAMESRLRGSGRALSECSPDELDAEWRRVKEAEHRGQPMPGATAPGAP